MSTARLNAWVTEVGEPCKIDSRRQWFVHVLHCSGEVLEWCGRRYVNLPTECGHLEIDIPPGCYLVVATWSRTSDASAFPTRLGNHITHLSLVRANCGDHVCVTLFPPTFHFCGIWWIRALHDAVRLEAVPGDLAERAEGVVREVLERTKGGGLDPLTEAMLRLDEEQPEEAG